MKDAYLNVEQPADTPVVVDAPLSYVRRYGPKRWKLGRILPGQRRGAQEWFIHLNVDLERQGLEAMVEVPTLYRAIDPEERKAAQVHVDDAMMTGHVQVVNPLLENLSKIYTIKVNGPFYPGDEFEFLKRRFRIEARRPTSTSTSTSSWGTLACGKPPGLQVISSWSTRVMGWGPSKARFSEQWSESFCISLGSGPTCRW